MGILGILLQRCEKQAVMFWLMNRQALYELTGRFYLADIVEYPLSVYPHPQRIPPAPLPESRL